MSQSGEIEPVSVLPDRLSAAKFSRAERKQILGRSKLEREMAAVNFNWIAAYLCEEMGLYEEEVVDWFRGEASRLYGESPLSIWDTEEGALVVFEYAKECKEAIDQDLAGEPEEHWMTRSHRLGHHAVEVVERGFKIAGIEAAYIGSATGDHTQSKAIHNPDKGDNLSVRWKGNGHMEDYRITMKEGQWTSSYFVVRCLPPDAKPFIMQTGVGRFSNQDIERKQEGGFRVDSDLDGRPPSIGEVASFVVPLATEVNNGSLAVMR